MRGIEALLLAAFLGLIGLGVWNARQWFPHSLSLRSLTASPGETNKASGAVAGKSATKAKTAWKRRFSRVGDPDPNLPVLKTEVEITGWHPAFPTVADLPVGASGVQIRNKYGEPTARITEMRTGHLLEHYYYFNPDRTRLTVAKLDSGVLVSAESVSR